MIAGLDSSSARPSAATALAAKAAGVGLWNGYLQTRGGVGIYSAWSKADFDNARLCGGKPIAWCSGWDDPVGCRRLADAWDVHLGIDVEGGGLRPDGSWIQGWLDAAGRDRTGLYGNYWVFQRGCQAAFYVVGGYPGHDPGQTWGYTARPPGPCGWQWVGGHSEFGLNVDRGWYDDWFTGTEEDDLPYSESQLIGIIQKATSGIYAFSRATYDGVKYGETGDDGSGHDPAGQPTGKVAAIGLLEKLAQAPVAAVDVAALAAALAPHLPPTVDVQAVAKAVVNEIGVRVKPT